MAAERRITSLAKHENPAMFMRDIMLFSCLVAFVAGLVIAAPTLLIQAALQGLHDVTDVLVAIAAATGC